MVVSNTSPLMNLAIINQLELLQKMFSSIHIPEAVWDELVTKGKGKPGSEIIEKSEWIQIHAVSNRHLVTALCEQLDLGESEAIALALERNASLLLLDESDGRQVARLYSIKITGVIGILIRAKRSGFISKLKPELDKLQSEAHFWINEILYQDVLRAVGE